MNFVLKKLGFEFLPKIWETQWESDLNEQNDEMYVDNDYWYDACDEYLQIAYALQDTYVLYYEQLDRLDCDCSFMHQYMWIFKL